MSLAVDHALLGALLTESIMYGICVAMSAVTCLVTLSARSEHAVLPHKFLLVTLLLMLILATSHLSLSFAWVFEGLIRKAGIPGGPSAYFVDMRTPVPVAKNAVLLIQALLGDNIYIWRCYIVWGRRKRMIIAPVITMIVALVFTCMSDYTLARTKDTVFDDPARWIKVFCAFMLGTIVYCNVAIIWKIWKTSRSTNSATIVVIIETGALYTANLIVFQVLYAIKSTAQYIILDLTGSLVPIIFCLIILQIKYHRASETSTAATASSSGLGSIRPATFATMEHFMPQGQKKQCGDTGTMMTAATMSSPGSMHQPAEIRVEMPQNVQYVTLPHGYHKTFTEVPQKS
ncbi:hypothetical protein DENSPDRAFT_885116 [Dentipellis sp. KUC8613]|nr:hypothetical protein DENSPDRAFT_885116 [Dentipellis sp. KUC8613]